MKSSWLIIPLIFLVNCQNENTNSLPPGALGPLPTVQFELGGETVEIEVAITAAEQRQGLMYRESMPENHGMLFVYDTPQYLSFWMKNTHIPLSIAFIRQDGVISNIAKMEPYKGPLDPLDHYNAKQRVVYALEMNQGWFEKHGIKAGDKIDLPFDEIEKMKQQKK